MVFNLANMINGIRTINGISFTDKDFFEYFFGTLAIKENVTVNGKPLSFESPRISEVMNGKENLYESIAKLAYKVETRNLLLSATNKAKKDLFHNVDMAKINALLGEMTVNDKNIINEIKAFSNESKEDEIFVSYVMFAMKLEYEDRKARKLYKIAKGNFVTKKADATICSELIEQIIRNAKFKKINTKHEHPWSLEDKMNVNNFNKPLKERIRETFDEYETVMTAIDNLTMVEVQARKTLYSRYQNAYCHVLSDMLGDNYTDGDIRKNSSAILFAVDDLMYEETLVGKRRIEEDVARYNLFCITVTVFYQCKFLLKVECEKR